MDQDKPRASWLPLIVVVIMAGLALTFITIKLVRNEPQTPNLRPPEPPPLVKETPKPEPPPPPPPKETPKEPPKTETPPPPPPVVDKPPEPPKQDIGKLKAELELEQQKLRDLEKQIRELPETPDRARKLKLLQWDLENQKEKVKLALDKIRLVAPDQVPTGPDRAQQRLTWEAAKKDGEALQRDSKWSSAVQRLQSARDECPDLAAEIEKEIKDAEAYLKDACSACDKALARARKELEAKSYFYAFRSAKEASGHVPDVQAKQKEISDLKAEIKKQALLTDMVRIPKHTFKFGDPDNPNHPLREIESKTFFMDATEVTVEMFALYILDTDITEPPSIKGVSKAKSIDPVARLPISAVTYAEAEAFAKWAGKRLPTEEEWERAARFIDGRAYPWGDKWIEENGQLAANAIDMVTAVQREGVNLKPVGSFPNGRSAEGVYDLAGNVWEWTATRVDQSVDGAPATFHVLKGGSFLTQREACRSFVRLLEDPGLRHVDVGFRCVRDAE